MKINLLPKEKQSQSPENVQHNSVGLIVGMAIVVFGLCFYLGYLYYEVADRQSRLAQLNIELNCYNTQYQQVKNIEIELNKIKEKNNIEAAVSANYLVPLDALTTLIQPKSEANWFEHIEFDSMNGSFVLTGGAINYKAMAEFIGQLEAEKSSFVQLKPEQATVHDDSIGREYIQFKISGILAKGSETNVP